MEEGTLQLAQSLARQSIREDEAAAAEAAEAADGSPSPLRRAHQLNSNNKLEGKLQGFR